MTRRWVALGAVPAVLLAASGACASGDGGAQGSAAPSSSSTVVAFTGDPDGPFCTVLRDYDGGEVGGRPSGPPSGAEATFTELLDVLARVAAAAPPELVQDTALVLEGVAALDDALRAVGYSYEALADAPEGPTVAAAANDPAFTRAGERIEAYKAQVCGL